MHTCTHMHIYTGTYMHVYACTDMHMYTYAHTYTRVHTCVYTHARVCTCTYMHTHMHIYTQVHTCTQTHTRTHPALDLSYYTVKVLPGAAGSPWEQHLRAAEPSWTARPLPCWGRYLNPSSLRLLQQWFACLKDWYPLWPHKSETKLTEMEAT